MQSITFLDGQQSVTYKHVVDKASEGIHWFNEKGQFIYVNDATCKMDGYTKEEFHGMYLSDIDPNFTKEQLPELMRKIRTTPNWSTESTHRKKDGTIYPIEVTGHGIEYRGENIICAFVRDITEKRLFRQKYMNANKDLKKSLQEKEVLLKEIHHRVKNNMEIISSLLHMQSRRSEDIHVKEILLESRSRIHTMALVHEFLYLGDNLAYIDLPFYIKKLVSDIKEGCTIDCLDVTFDLQIESVNLSANRCIQLGMVIHELTLNAFKYAFKKEKENIFSIHLYLVNDIIDLVIKDNGGVQKLIPSDSSIGMILVDSIISDQLGGSIEKTIEKEGLRYHITLPRKEIVYE